MKANVSKVVCIAILVFLSACETENPTASLIPGDITSIVGSGGHFGYTGDGGPATSASLGFITSVALDGAGNVYVVDGAANVVRKVNASTGTIATVAGTFLGGFNLIDSTPFAGDRGLATAAHMNVPIASAVAASGNIYIVDAGNMVIRKIDATTGIITTVAGKPHSLGYSGDGGPATEAEFWDPYDIAVDAAENIYVADADNNVIRKIDATTGIITTIAGLGPSTPGYAGDGGPATTAALSRPQGVAVDAAGNIYIADTGSNAVRKISVATGIITTAAGSGPNNSGYSGDEGLAQLAKLSYPSRVAVDSQGHIYISDSGNNVIRKVDQAASIITTVAGTGDDGFSGDGGPAIAARMSSPHGVAVDASGNLYIVDKGNSVIRLVKQ